MKPEKTLLIEKLKRGKVAVIATDTIYGLSADTFLKDSVEKIYQIKRRSPEKPLIILLSDISDLTLFKIKINSATKKILEKVWPGKISVILPCPSKKFHYLHRGTNSLAFRLPAKTNLVNLLKITGPLVSTSANPEGKPYAKTIHQAKKYFGNSVDFYANEGPLESTPSALIKLKDGKVTILRQGEEKI